MELKPGYKQTDVGAIPEDWNVECIEALANITTGSRNTQDRVEDGQYPFFVRSQTVERINSYSFDGEAILTAGDGVGTGKVFHYINGKFDVHQRVYRISQFDVSLDGLFFYLYFSTHFYNRIMQMTAKSSVDSVRRDMIARMLVPVPPPAEQQAIAGALSDVNGLIDALGRLIAKKRSLKQAAMQQLLTGHIRLPGFKGKWEMKRLGDVVDTDPENLGASTPRDLFFNYIALEDVDQGTLRSFSEQVLRAAPSRARRKLRDGDVLVSTVRPNLQSHLLFRSMPGVWVCSTGFCVIRCREHVTHPSFICSHFFGHAVTRQIDALLTGSNYPAINSADVRALSILLPSFDEQTAIAQVLSEMDAEIGALESRRDKTRLLKQGMMQELLTGRTRLVDSMTTAGDR
jgi:type I restriction enzyme, S subunit